MNFQVNIVLLPKDYITQLVQKKKFINLKAKRSSKNLIQIHCNKKIKL